MIQIKKGDVLSVKFIFTVTETDVAVDLTDTDVRLVVKKPSGVRAMQDCVLTDEINGVCEVILATQMYDETGYFIGEMAISKDGATAVTQQFEYTTVDSIADSAIIPESQYVRTTQNLSIWEGTEAEYLALEAPNPETLYFITG